MEAVIIRYQFAQANLSRQEDFIMLLKQHFGAGIHFIAEGTLILETTEHASDVYQLLTSLFSYDDKLFVGKLDHYTSLHHVPGSITPVSKSA